MPNSYFFQSPNIPITPHNKSLIEKLEQYSLLNYTQTYLINTPLGENKYSYSINDSFVLLIPKHKIILIHASESKEDFDEYIEDFIEDLGSISDKYEYKSHIGRPRNWRDELIESIEIKSIHNDIESFLANQKLINDEQQRKCELLISLLTGSINDIDTVKAEIPDTVLDKVKQKIILFDGEQSRFVYNDGLGLRTRKTTRIQGLSGTGKTELLLHKLKELYVNNENSRILFTCHNRILANSIKSRIPDFFNFMRVEEQIDWENRLRCVHGWGSRFDSKSGAYRSICGFYEIPFHSYSPGFTFEKVCLLALEEIKKIPGEDFKHAYDFTLIDESQDFPDSFFKLCEYITKTSVYIAGDIFQSIFDTHILSHISPDYLLSKCYRTDPRTLMFAHALGMGLFEHDKLRWLSNDEWKACGYNLTENGDEIILSREPLRRFEDITSESLSSMELVPLSGLQETSPAVIEIIKEGIVKENPTVKPHDIGIIFLDNGNEIYTQADQLEQDLFREFNWNTNKSYETKSKVLNEVFVSNINNVKGLEFPFVICIGSKLNHNTRFRNALYTMLTRSFIQSYLVLKNQKDHELLSNLHAKLKHINESGEMKVKRPSQAEIEAIRTRIEVKQKAESFHDFVYRIMTQYGLEEKQHEEFFQIIKTTLKENQFDEDKILKIIDFNLGLRED